MMFSENEVESFNFLGTIVENADWMSKKEKGKLMALHKVATNDIKRIQKGGKKRKRRRTNKRYRTKRKSNNKRKNNRKSNNKRKNNRKSNNKRRTKRKRRKSR